MTTLSMANELTRVDTWRHALAEMIATTMFVFLGAGAVVVTGILVSDMTPARLVTIALAHGVAITLLISATATISGGHINPAVTISAVVTGQIGLTKGAVYIGSQLVGAVVGAALIAAVVPGAIDSNLGSHGLGTDVGVGAGLLAEIVLTFLLVFVVFATAIDKKGLGHIAPVAIGLVVLVDHLIGVPLTGASMNPARSFGPALISGTWDTHWIYWVGPILGGGLAAVMYQNIFLKPREETG